MGDLYIMIGPSGSGKSTIASKIKESTPHSIIVSTDAIRKEKWGDAGDQREPQTIFRIAYSNTERYLKEGYNVIFDSTALKPKYRKNLREIAGNRKTFAVYVNTEMNQCIENDKARDRVVGEAEIRAQFGRLVKPTVDEGFDAILVVNPLNISS